MRTFDLAPLYRSTVGFDRLFSMLDGFEAAPGYPPYNIERTGENAFKVEGNITLRGITRPMTLDVTVADRRPDAPTGARYARFRGIGTIKRSEFGMNKYVDMVGDTVEIVIATDAWR